MDRIDFEFLIQIIKSTSQNEKDYLENLRLAHKIYMNSNY